MNVKHPSNLQAVMHCVLQETNFASVPNLQANEHTVPTNSFPLSTPPHAKQLPPCTISPSAFCSPPQATREDINALGLDSPDSFLDQLHRTSARPSARQSSLQVIAGRCCKILGQLPQVPAGALQHAGPSQRSAPDSRRTARNAESGAVLASACDAPKPASRGLQTDPLQQQQSSLPGRRSRFAETQPVQQHHQASARQNVQQLAGFLAQYKPVIVAGYAVDSQSGQLQRPAPPHRPMKSLKSVQFRRMQAGLPTDPASLLEEAGWQLHLQQSYACHQKGSSAFDAQTRIPPNVAPRFASSLPATELPLHSQAQCAGSPLPASQQMSAMQSPVGVTANAHTILSPSPPSTAITVTQHLQSGEKPAVAPVDAPVGSLAPPNTPEGLQNFQAGINSTLKTLGLTHDAIQNILRNAQKLGH